MPRSYLLALVVAVAAPQAAFALATEHFGNAPINVTQWNLPPDSAGVVNQSARVYWYEVNGWPVLYYRGDVVALNDALAAFAAMKTEHKQIRLRAGPGETGDLQQKKKIGFDWSVSIPNGFVQVGADEPVVMTVHVTVPLPSAKPDAAAVKKLIDNLDNPAFAVRDEVTKKLRDLGFAGVPAFQAALKTAKSAETRTRLEDLLGRLKGIDLQRLDLPPGVAVLGPKDQYELYRKQLTDTKAETRGRALNGFAASQIDRDEIVKELGTFLAKETHEYPLRCLASAVRQLGADAKPLLPALRKQLQGPDGNVKQAFADVIKAIEDAKPAPRSAEETKFAATLRADVQRAATEAREKLKPAAK